MRDVDDVENAERNRDSDGHGRIEAAEQQPGHHCVEQQVVRQLFPPLASRRSASSFPLPLVGKAGGGGRERQHNVATTSRSPPRPSPSRNRVYPSFGHSIE